MIRKEVTFYSILIILNVSIRISLAMAYFLFLPNTDANQFILQMANAQISIIGAFFYCMLQTYWVMKQVVNIYHIRKSSLIISNKNMNSSQMMSMSESATVLPSSETIIPPKSFSVTIISHLSVCFLFVCTIHMCVCTNVRFCSQFDLK